MRGLLLLALVAALGACGSGSSAGATGETSLTVRYWPNGRDAGERVTWTLRCDPARGTLPRPVRACTRLAAGGTRLFAPDPKNVVCTQIYGGPQVARITGTFRGRSVAASFSRVDGCEIARWSRLSPWLLPPGGVT